MAQSVSISGMVVGPCTYFNMFPWPFWARGHADVLPPHCFSLGSSTMEPTAEELASFRTAKDLCDWAELLDTEDAATSPRRTFLAALGATENTKLFLLAAIPESTWQYIMTEWNIGNLKPTAIQLASAGYIGIAARLASGTIPTRAQREQQKLSEMELELARAKAVPISALSSPGLIKMSTIIDQASDREVAPLGES